MSAASSLDAFARAKLAALEAKDLRRRLSETDPLGPVEVRRDGRTLLNFCSNDYLNLSQHPATKAAMIEATERFGIGSGASRLVTGNHPLFAQLETKLAELKGTQAAVVMGSGYLTNTGIIPTLVSKDDVVFADELSHACLLAGSRLSRGAEYIFRHNDVGHLADLLESHRTNHPHALIITDGVFSMDGDLAPVGELADLAESYDAWLLTDDAHGIGVVGGGRGSPFVDGAGDQVPLQMGTLSKAIGAYGGYLCASLPVIDLIKTRCRTLFYSTGLPAGVVAAAIAAIELIQNDPGIAARPVAKARTFTRALGLADAESPIVPVVLGDARLTLEASALLEREGFLVTAIRPPTVPEGTARLRVTFTAAHEDADILRLAELVATRILPE